jgi:hypothetical protein
METNKPTTLTQTNKTPPCVPSSVPEMNSLEQRKLRRQEQDCNPEAKRGLVHSSPTNQSGRASGRGTLGRGTSRRGTSGKGTFGRGTSGRGTSGRGKSGRGKSGRGTSGRGTSWRGISGRLSPAPDSPSSYCSTSPSEVFPAASASRRVGAAGRDV